MTRSAVTSEPRYPTPFIHRFRSDGGRGYAYDVNSNCMLSLDEVEFDIVPDICLPQQDLVAKWSSRHEGVLIEEAATRLSQAVDKGLLSPKRPVGMSPPLCRDCLPGLLRRGLHQLVLTPSENCNLRCKYCCYSGSYGHERIHNSKKMSESIAVGALRHFLDRIDPSEQNYVTFYGGEPLLAFDIVKRVVLESLRTAKRSDVGFSIDTNATLINKEIAEFLIENDFVIQISLDGPRAIHDRYRVDINGHGTFDRVMKSIRLIESMDENYYNRRLVIMVTLAPPIDFDILEEFFEQDSLRDRVAKINFVNDWDTSFFTEIHSGRYDSVHPEGLRSHYLAYIDGLKGGRHPSRFTERLFGGNLERINGRELSFLGPYVPPNGVCVPGNRELVVDADGVYYPCIKLGRIAPIGDVRRGLDQDAILALAQRYVEMSESSCKSCWAVRLCSLCYTSLRKGMDWDISRKHQNCHHMREALHEALIAYVSIMESRPGAFEEHPAASQHCDSARVG